MEPVRVPIYIINIDTSGIWLKLKNTTINYCRGIHHFSTKFQRFSNPTNYYCLVIESRKPSDQLAANIYINVMPISIALFKFLSCNDIILLVVHFFSRRKPVFRVIYNPCWKLFFMLILNLNCYIGIHILKTIISSLAQKCRLYDHVCRPTYLVLPPPPRTSYNLPRWTCHSGHN